MTKRYKIAEKILEIASTADNDLWAKVEWNYEPFETDDTDTTPAVIVEIRGGLLQIPAEWPMVYEDVPERDDMLKLYVYRDPDGNLYFKTIQPKDTAERAVLRLTPDYTSATVHLESQGSTPRPWQATASLTSALQLAYYFATLKDGNLLSHASSVLKDGRAYLFLGKSGTGKSTHSRMWREAFDDAVLLNDDHPIVRVGPGGEVTAYGSPWSGKTPCYKCLSAPIGAIVRISRNASNSLRRLSALEAYASVMPSMFNAPFDRRLTDLRHKWLERVISSVRCYQLECRPDTDAARVCLDGIKQNENLT